jgi:hypothetical protein
MDAAGRQAAHRDFELDATFDGAVKSDSEIDAVFNWVSKDLHVAHEETCALKKKKAP